MARLFMAAMTFVLGGFIQKFVSSLGVGLVSYVMLVPVVRGMINLLLGELASLPHQVLQLLEIMGLSSALSILFSAVVARVVISSFGKKFMGSKAKDYVFKA